MILVYFDMLKEFFAFCVKNDECRVEESNKQQQHELYLILMRFFLMFIKFLFMKIFLLWAIKFIFMWKFCKLKGLLQHAIVSLAVVSSHSSCLMEYSLMFAFSYIQFQSFFLLQNKWVGVVKPSLFIINFNFICANLFYRQDDISEIL